ncbi:unnamed protein product [Closterium sp. NIES-54]
MDVWGPACVSGQGREHYFLLVVDDYTRYTTVFPLHSKGEVLDVLIPWIRAFRLQLRDQFHQDLPVLCLHSDRGGEFSSDLLRDFCHGEGILQSFTLPASTQQNGIAERRIGLVMEVAPTFMIHAAAPHFLWSFADVTFDESVPIYCLFPYRSAPLPSLPLFLAPGPPLVAVDSGAARGAASGGAASWGAEPARVEPGGSEPEGAGSGGAEPGGAGSEGAELEGAEPGGAESECAESGGVAPARTEPAGTLSTEGPSARGSAAGGTGAGAAGGMGDAGAGGAARVGAGGTGAGAAGGTGAGAAGGTGAAGAGGVAGVGDGDPRAGDSGAGGAGPGGAGAVGAGSRDIGRPRPYFVPLLQQVPGLPSSTGLTPPLLCPLPDQSQPPLQPASPLPAPSPYTEQTGGLTERCELVSRPASPVRTSRRVPRQRPPPVPCTHHMALRPSSIPLRAPLPSPPASTLAGGPDPESDRDRAASPTVPHLLATVITDPSFESAAASGLIAELVDFAAVCRLDYATSLVAESVFNCPPSIGDPDAPDIPTPHSYAEAITGPYSSQWQTAMDAEMASWKSAGTYVNAFPPRGANIVDGMWIFSVKWPSGSPPAFKARSLHEEIWLRRPPGFTRSFPAVTQWSFRRPVYGLHQAPREWHDTLRTTLAALGFAPSTADPSLFLRTDTSLPPFYVLVYLGLHITRDRARRTITLTQSHMVHQVPQRFGFRYSLPQSTPLPTGHSLSAPPSDESVGPSGPYPELVGCLMYLMTCTRPDLAYPLSILARYIAPGRHRSEHWEAAKRVLRYLCSTSGMGLVLGGRGSVVLSCPHWTCGRFLAAMATQELRWLTYLLTDLGERLCSSLVLYVDNKAMIALCQEHRTKHITQR